MGNNICGIFHLFSWSENPLHPWRQVYIQKGFGIKTASAPLFGEQFWAVTTVAARIPKYWKQENDMGESKFHLCTPLPLSHQKKEGEDEVEKFLKAQHREIDWS